jgi:hypothetical protein
MIIEYRKRGNLVTVPKYVFKSVQEQTMHDGFACPLVHTFAFALAYAAAHAG